MLSIEQENQFEDIKNQLRVLEEQSRELRNKEYLLNKEQLKLVKEKCRGNVGRCFVKVYKNEILYCKIININNPSHDFNKGGTTLFNPYQYPTIWFKYPYNNSLNPFYEEDLFYRGDKREDPFMMLGEVSYTEISKEEFFEKFNEVNESWVENIRK